MKPDSAAKTIVHPQMSDPLVITLGCRLNAYESEVMRGHMRAAGISDAVIVNTCAVTAEAVRQAAQTIRRVRRERPAARIIVTGCAAQIEPERFAALAEVDHVVGNDAKLRAETYASLLDPTTERVLVDDIMSVRETASHLLGGFGTRARAYVQVQNGCDHRCTFCVIPFGRGPSRSVPAGAVVAEIRALVAAGYREVVLTGVDITSYGADLPGSGGLGRLVRQILRQVPELSRLRLSSIDSIEADADLMHVLAEDHRLMPHLHLSLQSGDDLVLKRMKRRHLRADAIRFCDEVRRLRPDVVLGADLIAGFPTESDAMFEATARLVDDCGLTHVHVFPFSPRPGTPAARMPQVPRKLVKERAARLRALGEQALARYLERQVGAVLEVLTEEPARGRTPHFTEVTLDRPSHPGELVCARIAGHDSKALHGEVLA